MASGYQPVNDRSRTRAGYARGRRAGLLAVLVAASLATAEEPRSPPPPLRQVTLGVEITHPLPAMTAGDLTTHLGRALQAADPAITLHEHAVDRVRLAVSVQPTTATTLRGFWLPFSGTYGIGTLRLTVERMVTVPGVPRPVPAILWQAERPVGGPWSTTERQIVRLLHEMVAGLVEAGRAQRPMKRRRERTKSTIMYSPRRSGAEKKARPWLMRAISSTKPIR
jgi:hypothetical protein